jgi:type 1 glutamine amidotransferase
MRSLTIHYFSEKEVQERSNKLPRATLTFLNQIPDQEMQKLLNWIKTGQGNYSRVKQKISINIVGGA